MSGLLQSGLATELGLPSGKTGGREGAASQTIFSHVPCRHGDAERCRALNSSKFQSLDTV